MLRAIRLALLRAVSVALLGAALLVEESSVAKSCGATLSDNCLQAEQEWVAGRSMQDPPAQLALYEKAITLCPSVGKFHYSAALVFEKSGRLEEAINAFKVAASSRPPVIEAAFNVAILLENVRRYDEARTYYNVFIDNTRDIARYDSYRVKARMRVAAIDKGKAEYAAGLLQYNQDLQQYLANMHTGGVGGPQGQSQSVKALTVLSQTSAALLDYYGTANDDQMCELIAKSQKLLNCLIYQEKEQAGAGIHDPRLLALVELTATLAQGNVKVHDVLGLALPKYPKARPLGMVKRDIAASAECLWDGIGEEGGSALGSGMGVVVGVSGDYRIVASSIYSDVSVLTPGRHSYPGGMDDEPQHIVDNSPLRIRMSADTISMVWESVTFEPAWSGQVYEGETTISETERRYTTSLECKGVLKGARAECNCASRVHDSGEEVIMATPGYPPDRRSEPPSEKTTTYSVVVEFLGGGRLRCTINTGVWSEYVLIP